MKTLPVGVMVLAIGCSTVESEDILTSGIVADILVQADSLDTAAVEVTLTVGSSLTFVRLSSGDRLVASAAGQTKELAKATDAFGVVTYGAQFDAINVGTESTQFTISFERDTVDAGAPTSRVLLPATFTALDVQETACPWAGVGDVAISRGSGDFCLAWDPNLRGDEIDWAADAVCIVGRTGAVTGDPGEATLQAFSQNPPSTTCQVTLAIYRSRVGQLDAAFEGGRIVGQQYADIAFDSAP